MAVVETEIDGDGGGGNAAVVLVVGVEGVDR